MTFRYDMQDKTPQQQAIVRQREEREKLLQKEREKQNKENEIKTTNKKQCPYCDSDNVEDTGFSHGIGVGSNDGSLPKINNHQYKCLSCNKTFRYVRE